MKSLIRFPFDIRRARRLLDEKASDFSTLSGKPVVLDLRTPQLLFDCGRHLASLAHYARESGSPLCVRCRPLLIASIARKIHGREMLSLSSVRWLRPNDELPEDALVMCDYEPALTAADSRRSIRMMIGRDIDRSLPVMPYPMHPWTLRHADRATLLGLRNDRLKRSIFFAGNQKPKYGDAKMKRNFGVLSRLEILKALAETYQSRVTSVISDVNSLSSGPEPIVISDSRVQSIAPSDWLPTLAKARFFVCCPGASQPTCHNLVEAMSVGTIPIIEYGDRVTPELVDGRHAICFQGRRGLLEAIERIDSLSAEALARLSRNVYSFYDEHLCGTKFLAKLRDGGFDSPPARVCMPFHERNFYDPDAIGRGETVRQYCKSAA